jgi:hypothetical protein
VDGTATTLDRAVCGLAAAQVAHLTMAPLLLVLLVVPLFPVDPLTPVFPLLPFPPSDGVHDPPGRPTQLLG